MTVVLPTNKFAGFMDGARRCFSDHCADYTASHVLSAVERSPTNTVAADNPCCVLLSRLRPCVIVRGFSVTNGLLKECFENLYVTTSRYRLNSKLDIDLFIISRQLGPILMFHVPKSTTLSKFWNSEKQEKVYVVCDWVQDLSRGTFSPRAYFLLYSIEQLDASIDLQQIVLRDKVDAWAQEMLDGRPSLPDMDSYISLCSIITALWCKFTTMPLVTLKLERQMVTDGTGCGDPKPSFGNINEFRRYCDQQMVDPRGCNCKLWNSSTSNRTYMIPPIFRPTSKEAVKLNAKVVGASGATDLSRDRKMERRIGHEWRDSEAERIVYENLERGARRSNRKIVMIHGLKLRQSKASNSCVQQILCFDVGSILDDLSDVEIDFICLSPLFGVVLIEVKAASELNRVSNGLLKQSVLQLNKAEACVQRLMYLLGIRKGPYCIRKLALFPRLSVDKPQHKEQVNRIVDYAARHGVEVGVGVILNSDDVSHPMNPYTRTRMEESGEWILQKVVHEAGRTWLNSFRRTAKKVYVALTPVLATLHRFTDSTVCLPLLLQESVEIAQCSLVKNPQMGKWLSQMERTGGAADRKRDQTHVVTAAGTSTWNLETSAFRSGPSSDFRRNALNVYFLTPEQMNAWNGPSRQVIDGAAGTGKTILLLARLKALLLSGEYVVMFARGPSKLIYDSFVAENGLDGSKFRCYRTADLKVIFSRLWDIICYSKPNEMKTSLEADDPSFYAELSTATSAGLDSIPPDGSRDNLSWNLLYDDAMRPIRGYYHDDGNPTSEGFADTFRAFCPCLLRVRSPKLKSVWIACDSELGTHDEWRLSRLQVYTSFLTTAMRSSCSVAGFSHSTVAAERKRMGHRFNGMIPRHYDLTEQWHATRSEMVLKACQIVEDELAELIPLVETPRQLHRAVVLIEYKSGASHSLRNDLRSELDRRGISTLSILDQIMNTEEGDDKLAVDFVDCAHSLEWPIVFFLRYTDGQGESYSHSRRHTQRQCNYVARSRAVTALVEIILCDDTQGMTNSALFWQNSVTRFLLKRRFRFSLS